jgi:lipopolysaccharide transport system ATP-binding protein
MAPEPAIEVRSLTKTYRLGEHYSLGATARTILRGRRPDLPLLEALRGISFEVRAGECLGLVGANGSGKSTFLEILAGVTVPTSGEVAVRGTVLPLLAVGSGFHPELTGRENVELFGTILGLRRQVVAEHMPRIAEFSEVETHLDTPIKRYSDGMQARLSFAVAMCFPADCYVFDEVLAVVDGDFRKRCLVEIAELSNAGKTVLFVSHNLDQTSALCDRVLWLDRGEVRDHGPAAEVLPEYQAALDAHAAASG